MNQEVRRATLSRPSTMKCFCIHIPGWTYAANFYGTNEREARAAAREWLGVSRLPRGTTVWLYEGNKA